LVQQEQQKGERREKAAQAEMAIHFMDDDYVQTQQGQSESDSDSESDEE
jgi:hypothetical protein